MPDEVAERCLEELEETRATLITMLEERLQHVMRVEAARAALADEYEWQAINDCACHCCQQRVTRARDLLARLSPSPREAPYAG
jgi:hypothetical protein